MFHRFSIRVRRAGGSEYCICRVLFNFLCAYTVKLPLKSKVTIGFLWLDTDFGNLAT